MIVHFIASEKDVVRDINELRQIVKLIHGSGHSLARDWIEPTYARRSNPEDNHQVDWTLVCNDSLEAIAKADVVIAEGSHESLSIGYQISYAIQQKKSTLVLRKEGSDRDAFVTGLTGPNVSLYEYNNDSLEEIVKRFFDENTIDTKDMRFNFFIDRNIYNYLRWSSLKSGRTKAEILRELVQKEIEKGL